MSDRSIVMLSLRRRRCKLRSRPIGPSEAEIAEQQRHAIQRMLGFDSRPRIMRDLENAAGNTKEASRLYLAGIRDFDEAEDYVANSGKADEMVAFKTLRDVLVTDDERPSGPLVRKKRI